MNAYSNQHAENSEMPKSQSEAIRGYYRETQEDYSVWSREGYMHFGFWRKGLNPLHRKSMLEAMNDEVFIALKLNQLNEGTVGDLGCGIGAVTHYGSRKYPHLKWEAITVSPDQTRWGNERFHGPNMLVREADYHQLPWDNESMAGFFFLESLCHSPAPERAIQEAYRALKPGKRLVVVDGFYRRPEQQTPKYFQRMARYVSNNWAVERFHAIGTIEGLMRESGFRIVEKRELGYRIAPSVIHSPFLTVWHAAKLTLQGKATSRQWGHLAACGLSLFLGLHRPWFGYYLVAGEKA